MVFLFISVLKMLMFLTVRSILKEKMEPASFLFLSPPPWLIHISRDRCSKAGGNKGTSHPFNSILTAFLPCARLYLENWCSTRGPGEKAPPRFQTPFTFPETACFTGFLTKAPYGSLSHITLSPSFSTRDTIEERYK